MLRNAQQETARWTPVTGCRNRAWDHFSWANDHKTLVQKDLRHRDGVGCQKRDIPQSEGCCLLQVGIHECLTAEFQRGHGWSSAQGWEEPKKLHPGSKGTTRTVVMVLGRWAVCAQSTRNSRVTVLGRQAEFEAEEWTHDQAPNAVLELSGVKV